MFTIVCICVLCRVMLLHTEYVLKHLTAVSAERQLQASCGEFGLQGCIWVTLRVKMLYTICFLMFFFVTFRFLFLFLLAQRKREFDASILIYLHSKGRLIRFDC